MSDQLSAIANVVIGAATVIYAVFSILLWRATKRLAELTNDSIEHNRLVFQATHRPFIGVTIDLERYQDSGDWLLLTCTAKNLGLDQAISVEIECSAGLDLFHGIYRFGDLQPQEARSNRDRFNVGGALAKAWVRELNENPPLRFQCMRQFRESSGQQYRENAELRYDPPDVVRRTLEARASKV